jgi:hypothetical protein
MCAVVAQPVLERPINPTRIGDIINSTMLNLFTGLINRRKNPPRWPLEYELQIGRSGRRSLICNSILGRFIHVGEVTNI